MKFLPAALATALPLLARGDARSPPALRGPAPASDVATVAGDAAAADVDVDAWTPAPPGTFARPAQPPPGSDAVLPAEFVEAWERQAAYEAALEGDDLRLASAQQYQTEDPPASLHLLILRMCFDEDPCQVENWAADHGKPELQDLFNKQSGFTGTTLITHTPGDETSAPTGSVRDFFDVNSGGAFAFQATVTDWIQMDRKSGWYGKNGNSGRTCHGACNNARFKTVGIPEALGKLAEAGFDFSPFSYFENAVTDRTELRPFGILVSSHGAEAGGDDRNKHIWSHKSSGLDWTIPNQNGAVANRYFVNSYYHQLSDTDLIRPGMLAHEVGHAVGLLDMYDQAMAVKGNNYGYGLGNFDTMAYGKWGFTNNERIPTSLSAYSKVQLGWAEVTEITENGVYTAEAGINQVFKIARGFPAAARAEYLLLENRQPGLGYDSEMTGGGIAIYHVDEEKHSPRGDQCSDRRRDICEGYPGMTSGTYPQNGHHYRVHLVASTGAFELEKKTSRGDGDLLWHSGSQLQELNGAGPDNTNAYQLGNVVATGITLSEFSASGTSMTFRVTFDTDEDEEPQLRGPAAAVAREVR